MQYRRSTVLRSSPDNTGRFISGGFISLSEQVKAGVALQRHKPVEQEMKENIREKLLLKAKSGHC